MKVGRSLLVVAAFAGLAGCAGTFERRSETPVSDEQIAALPQGLDRSQLLQRLGPPADEGVYPNINETVLSWRLVEPGNQRWLFNAHLDSSGRVTRYSRVPDPAATGGEGESF